MLILKVLIIGKKIFSLFLQDFIILKNGKKVNFPSYFLLKSSFSTTQ